MERDSRRGRGQWRGIHIYDNIVCEGDRINSYKRKGALKQGETYYYYYELNGSTETHDSNRPTTNNCPFLPGQTVNTLSVPTEQRSLGNRSVSMNNLRPADYKTALPDDRFITPRPAPPVPATMEPRNLLTRAADLRPKTSAPNLTQPTGNRKRSMSTRRILGGLNRRACSRGSDKGSIAGLETDEEPVLIQPTLNKSRGRQSIRSTASSNSLRDMSPDSLRRYLLSDDTPDGLSQPASTRVPKVLLPDEDADDVDADDDDNFATSAVREHFDNDYVTNLSPPPSQRSHSAPSFAASVTSNAGNALPPPVRREGAASRKFNREPLRLSSTSSRPAVSEASSMMNSPASISAPSFDSIQPHENWGNRSFFDDSDDDDLNSVNDEQPQQQPQRGRNRVRHNTYTLPQLEEQRKTRFVPQDTFGPGAEDAVAADDTIRFANTDITLPPIEAGLGHLSIGWADDGAPRAL